MRLPSSEPGAKITSTNRWKPVLGALLAALAANFAGVLFFFRPIAESDTTRVSAPPPPVALLTYVALCIAVFDWTARRIGGAFGAVFVVGASRSLLVIDLLLRGARPRHRSGRRRPDRGHLGRRREEEGRGDGSHAASLLPVSVRAAEGPGNCARRVWRQDSPAGRRRPPRIP